VRATLVAGTWAWKPGDSRIPWWQSGSPFCACLAAAGIPVVSTKRPFIWSTDLDMRQDSHMDWRAGGVNLYAYLVPDLCEDRRLPPEQTLVIAHSHGGQVALYAAAEGLKIDTLITVATPVRGDMAAVIVRARPNIRFWRHIHGGWKDHVQLLGGLLDGRFSLRRAFPEADENVEVSGATHSEFLNDQVKYLERWRGEWLPKPRVSFVNHLLEGLEASGELPMNPGHEFER
jgi:pimeloyl-ACP methyl ester carboxylesterase